MGCISLIFLFIFYSFASMTDSVSEEFFAGNDAGFPVSAAVFCDYFETDDDACTAELLSRNGSASAMLRIAAGTSKNRSVSNNKRTCKNLFNVKISDTADITMSEYDSDKVYANLSVFHCGSIIVGFIEDSDGKKAAQFT
ncbi:MAG: hypothetical protein IJ703_05470 [Eubacterium sp.]|nr:hypothetical protein [Eubacterium sp.]